MKKWCVFLENRHFQGFGAEKYDSDVKILKKLNFGQLLRHNHQGKPQKYQKMHILGYFSPGNDAVFIKINADMVQGVRKTMVTSKFSKNSITVSYDVIITRENP